MLHHSWNISPRDAIALQRELARQVRAEPLVSPIATIAGADCAFVGAGLATTHALAAVVLLDAKTLEMIGSAQAVVPCTFPYVPGLLSFREAPAIIAAIEKLPRRPDLLMIDGQGIAHPRGLGIASHLGLWLDMPTIGAAKSRLCGEHRWPGLHRGNGARLIFDGKVVGRVLRTRDGVAPIYVSLGHRIVLEQAVRWCLRCAINSRLPEPTRRAHQMVSLLKASLPAE